MKVLIKTLGCKVNSYESESIEEDFVNHGYEITDNPSDADVIIINTCTVTNQADAKSRKIIRQLRRENDKACLVVCGCSSEHHKDNIKDLGMDILIGNHGKMEIYNLVQEWNKNHEQIIKFTDMRKVQFENMGIRKMVGKTRGFVKIQDGCNNFCSYCIIPFMRGNIRSKDINDAINEINNLVNDGYQEIVLTGIHTGSYGDGEDYDLTDLIHEISKNDKLKRIRISSIEITELDDKFLKEFKENKKICPHLHVPVQCPNDKILKLMNRKYTLQEYKDKVNVLRSLRDNVNITTDLIVGFPGETDEDFMNIMEECKNIGFSKIHTFPYSKREGTKASIMEQVKDDVKKDRVDKMLRLSDILESKYYQSFIGKELNVLVETDYGLSDNYIKVELDKECKENTFVDVKICEVDGTKVKGIVIK
ncbi:MAG: tRNA (N(6)-L-threonylcarbamoyladenosine(37)-C(2))-methylthiotransferase MtaB [Bacilli bacterium]|nr:tRNA (N(6)-L-threonylcarbamoyladenosine(37)-C(2))-methylthiotransferase MtaB [Bacilli bacterium]